MRVDYEIGIVGAGFGGIIAALELKRAGFDSFIIFERGSELGGVWRDNVYPGCACDIRSHLYSIATEPNPEWATSYASQQEILRYLKKVAGRNDLHRRIRFSTEIAETRFLEEHACWEVIDQSGRSCYVRMLILATGPQSRPYTPNLQGIASFEGSTFHSSAWNSSVDLAGKRVAVVGTGASGIQIVPNIAPIVSQVLLFQRTPAWILPRGDRAITDAERWLFRNVPVAQRLARAGIYWLLELVGSAYVGQELVHQYLTRIALRKLRRQVNDPALRDRLTPRYKIGCKRVLVSDDFYPAMNRSNVQLITDNISEIAGDGIRTDDGRFHNVDHIIFATGFTVADTDNYLRVVGRNGRVLQEDWDTNAPQAYLGINVAGYPNMALLLGPNSGIGHSSVLHLMESQMKYIIQYVAELSSAGWSRFLDVDPEVQDRYNVTLQKKLQQTVFLSGCKSWYLNRQGRNTTLFPGLTWRYRRATAQFNVNDYVWSPAGHRQSVFSEEEFKV